MVDFAPFRRIGTRRLQARWPNKLLGHLGHLRETNDLFGNLAKLRGTKITLMVRVFPRSYRVTFGREDREKIFDCVAGVVGASRFEFLGRAVAVGHGNRSNTVRAGGFDIEVAVTDHVRSGGINGLLFEQATEQGRLGVMERADSVRVYRKEVGVQGEFFEDPQAKSSRLEVQRKSCQPEAWRLCNTA